MIIDRFEGDLVIIELENKQFIELPKSVVPEAAKEGDVLKLVIDKDQADSRRTRIQSLMDELF